MKKDDIQKTLEIISKSNFVLHRDLKELMDKELYTIYKNSYPEVIDHKQYFNTREEINRLDISNKKTNLFLKYSNKFHWFDIFFILILFLNLTLYVFEDNYNNLQVVFTTIILLFCLPLYFAYNFIEQKHIKSLEETNKKKSSILKVNYNKNIKKITENLLLILDDITDPKLIDSKDKLKNHILISLNKKKKSVVTFFDTLKNESSEETFFYKPSLNNKKMIKEDLITLKIGKENEYR